MAYVAVSRGAYDAQLFTNDREKLGVALGRDVSHQSALAPEVQPQEEIAPKQEIEHSYGWGITMHLLPAPDPGSVAYAVCLSRPQLLRSAFGSLDRQTA